MPILGAFIVPHPPLIVPAVGRGQQKKVQSTVDAYEQAGREITKLAPETVVIISPHAIQYGDYIHISPGKSARGDFGQFNAPDVTFEKNYDTELAKAIADNAERERISAGMLGERNKALDHGVLVPLYFIEQHYHHYDIVRISISSLPAQEHYRFGKCITTAADALNRRIVIVASGDLSHKLKEDGPYGYAEDGPAFDKAVTDAMKTANFMRFLTFNEDFTEAAAECGLRSFIIMAGALDGMAVKTDFLSYEGTFGVGYAVCRYTIENPDPERQFGRRYAQEQSAGLQSVKQNEDQYVSLARQTLEGYIKTGKKPPLPEDLPEEMLKYRAGVFVSLKKDGMLRGCIGTISPVRPSIAEEIAQNAVSAGTGDPRFDPVTEDELPALVYSVDVLKKPEPIGSINELDVKRYGVIVTKGSQRGLLLPNLEGINTPKQQVDIALQKAGISHKEDYRMERFEVVRHK